MRSLRTEPPAEDGEEASTGDPAFEHLQQVLAEHVPTWGGRRPLVLSHQSPDPDALGAMFGLAFLLERGFGLDPGVAASGEIRRAENQAMVRELGLAYEELEDLDPDAFGGVLLVDTQPGFGHTPLPAGIPILAVFDHHRPPPPEKRPPGPPPPHEDIRLGVGATSAIVYGYVRAAGLELDARTATALCCGVRFDTGDLSLDASPLDSEAFYETFRRADREALARITRPHLPPAYYAELHRSLHRARRRGTVVTGFLGAIHNPESVAEMADFFLRMEGIRVALVGGAHGRLYRLSLRTVGVEAYPIMEGVLRGEGSFGGRGSVAGGQIPLETGDPDEVRRVERRLRRRLLGLLDPADRRAPAVALSKWVE